MPARLVVCNQAPVPLFGALRRQGAARYNSTAAAAAAAAAATTPTVTPVAKTTQMAASSTQGRSPLSRLPTLALVRSLVLTQFMSSPLLMKPALPLLHFIAKSKMALFNPDRNPVLNRLLRWTIYDHFCAGENLQQVTKTVNNVKRMGYQGVILNYAKEIVLDTKEAGADAPAGDYAAPFYEMVDLWKKGNIETLRMLAPGDFLALKITGAGPIAVDAMRAHAPIPDVIRKALDEMCDEARKQGSRLWIDAEQQALQPQLDEWTIDLMRRHNRESKPLVYNTIQSYLKASKANAERHIALAAREGWSLGVKLVRGAYIENETRSLIHDTKEDTDRNFDDITDMFISQRLPPSADASDLSFPSSALFLATHNAASSSTAIANHRRRLLDGLPTTELECGQLLGMADELSCELLDNYDACLADSGLRREAIPKPFKYLPWGSVSECMGYLHRRAVENKGAIEQSAHMLGSLKSELRRRVFG